MALRKKPAAVAIATAISAATALSACGGGSTGGTTAAKTNSTVKGGTLTYLYASTVTYWDPQRSYIGVDISNESRLFSRSLVQLPVTTDAKTAQQPIPDLATNTGTKTDNAKTWSFTLKSGVKWQDGKPVTCEDAKYGLERNFNPNLTGGPTYAWNYLNIPHQKGGLPSYQGPGDTKNQATFDKAVSCSGNTITYKFNKPFPDFPLALASLREFDPYRKDKDTGTKAGFAVFSDGPYMLQGTWQTGTGGTFVRNPKYDAKTDGNRKALPNEIVFKENITPDVAASRLIADNGPDQGAVEYSNVPPASIPRLSAGNVKSRVANPQSPYTDYLVPNFKRLTNPKVREALAVSVDQSAYIKAYGGPMTSSASKDLVNPALLGYKANPTLGPLGKGDAAAAKKILQSAGVPMPYPLTFAYSNTTPARIAGAAALAATWTQAGFKVTLAGNGTKYYPTIQTPSNTADIYWAGWAADWPAQSTVLPPLFDSRVNLTAQSKQSDYGSYSSPTVNALFDKAAMQSSLEGAAAVYNEADAQLGKDYAYFPLVVEKFVLLHGSKVTNYINNPATSMYPDLGSVGVSQ